MASTAFIVRYKHKEAVKASSIPECILIVAGCFIGYICAILTLFDATDLLCEIRMWTLVLGFSTALSTLVSKNILLGVMFEYRIRKPQKLMFKIRCGNACVIALIVGMLVYWTETNDGMTHLDLFQDSSSYYNLCINNSWNVFYVGVCLYLALVLSLFFIRNVRWSTYNESTTISIITLSIPLLYFMMDTVSSKNNASINSANRRAACIWALVTIILIMVVGTRIFDFITEEGMLSSLINRFFKRISKMKTSVANLAEARTDYVRAASSTTSVQRTGFSLSKKTGTYKRRLLLMTTDFHVYRARVNEQRKWSNWKKEVAELNYMNGRVWLSLLSSSSTACFIIVDIGVQMRIDGSLVIIESSSNKGDKDQFPMKYTLQLEYESPETAQAFASELKQALEWK
ncbi:hypothetical protein BDR26DRAFT_608621 [Obelidium mucronatum]|nr:hypothetical protein BDR26DRAFT_608621 [Obelidium mucronatum]